MRKGDRIIAIDFDHTLCDTAHPVEGKKMGAPMPGALEVVEELQDRGYGVIVFTINNVQVVGEWLDYYNFDCQVTSIKPAAEVYVDDKALRFTGNWQQTLKELEVLTGWVEVD